MAKAARSRRREGDAPAEPFFDVRTEVVQFSSQVRDSSFVTLPSGRVGPKGRRGGEPSQDATRRFCWGTVG